MCFLDEHAVSAYSAADPDRTFAFLPDVTNTNLPAMTPALVMEIQRRAAGRNVVLMCGSIEGRKNVGAFCQLALKADPARWFFAMVGQAHPHTFSQQDQNALKHFIDAHEGNTFYSDTFFRDERDMNAVIQASDILFAAYKNFTISSNMLGKTAHFTKPILVSDGFLMGDRVRRYGIGMVVDQDDVQDMLGALERLAKNPVAPEHFAMYRAEFSEQTAGDSLGKFLTQALVT
jgi:glycosyltransferase involved in cell wall biosynthesis